MQPYKGSDFLEAGTLSRSRSTSLSSDSHARVNLMSPPSARPSPAFISPSAASEIITSDQEFNAADFVPEDEETGAGADALVTPAALSLLNGFLDNLLFNVLAASKSTQLSCIRPAVSEVLKPRLASEVVATADEELSEYMGGAEDEQNEFRGGQEPRGDFDLVRSWKLTRLRCMVYTRLGDLEEEDEDEFIAQERLGESDGAPRRFSSHVDNVTPAAAIFLTSIIEHIGERALVIAGETARSRLSAKLNDGASESIDPEEERKRIDRLVVEDLDMEKLALNATLGRLWRTWRKRRRNSTISRTVSRESFRRRGYSTLAVSRKSSVATIEEPVTLKEAPPEEVPAPVDPAEIPLPMGDYDVQEIEVPGFSHELEGEVQTMQAVVAHKVRPRSLMVFTSPAIAPKSPGARDSPVSASAIDDPKALSRHARSRSLPNAAAGPPREVKTSEEPAVENAPSPSSSEKSKQLETMYEDDESAEFVDAAESAPGIAITTPIEEAQDPLAAAENSDDSRMSVVQEEEEDQAPPVNETIASLRSSADDDEGVTDQSNRSARVSVSSLDDQPTNDPEVIEGRGMCEKPKPTAAIQRPRRKPSRDATAQINATAIDAETSEAGVQPLAEKPPTTQGVKTTAAPSATTIEAVNSSNDDVAVDDDQHKSVMAATNPSVPAQEEDGAAVEKSPSPQAFPALESETSRPTSASGDSERSQKTRTRHRPSPLVVTASNRNSPTATERERAAVQRMPPRPSTSVPSAIQPTKSRRSESFSSSRDKRPVTAGSTTSQVSSKITRLMGRQGDSPSLRLRSSSETSRASGSADSDGNDTTDLDRLINSDETIHYTLTPKSVREMTFPEPPRPIPRSDTADTSDLADFLKNTAPPGEEARPQTSVSTKANANAETTSIGRTKSAESPKYIPISSRMPPQPKSTGNARDARPARDSTREIAEFIKSTGPATPTSSPTPTNGTRPSRPQSTFSTSTNNTNSTYNTNNTNRSNKTNNSHSSRRGPRLQARTAEATKRSPTSELIDFIREGPPQQGSHRIPRTVAPFRNTIDSEDLKYDSFQSERDTATQGSTTSSAPNKSLTSLGSRTGLLDSANRANVQARAASPAKPATQDDPMPARKQRRVPDPYAIDDDDDDDMLAELINEKPPPRQEESLMDFLRNAPPPPESEETPQPFSLSSPSVPSSSNGSTGGLKSRFLRAGDKGPSSKISMGSLRSQSSLGNNQANYSQKIGLERNPGSMPSTSHKQSETSALADFLRNTGPPEPPAGRNAKKDNTFSRLFVRRKKVEV
ncbi:hypothetical protein N7532_011813 [Penicillium argentinense]|uniref:Uncharacterized protein n=1 Tax=Penicillium argentinense TaxID=1131581 RepID=A0A9W9JVB2_9EURO|nr:uncharacterized protein N7532_011813 [Penicillium argentinense]KAJ5082770.1 hypothetical protein N7532_011813 [Penicillium argentinense]